MTLRLSVDLDGHILFADTGNALIRAYVPSTTYLIDDLAGVVVNGLPQGGFNGDGRCATDTQLLQPWGVTGAAGARIQLDLCCLASHSMEPGAYAGSGRPDVACRSACSSCSACWR